MPILQLALLIMLIAAVVSILAERFRFPYTIALVLSGFVVGSLQWLPRPHVSSEALLTLLILPLLFEGSLRLAPATLRTYGWLIGALAVGGTLIAALGIGGFAAEWGLPVRTALVLGAIAAATDPISVIALIREARLGSRLGTILEGEAVLNDAVAIVLFTLMVNPATVGVVAVAVPFVWLLGAGGVIGVGLGAGISYLLGRLRLPQVELLGSLILAIAAFIVAEQVGASGVTAVVVAGVVFGSYGIQQLTTAAQDAFQSVWDFIAFLANSVLFFLIGLEAPGIIILKTPKNRVELS